MATIPGQRPYRKLTAADRRALIDAYGAGKSYRQIGALVGRPKNWVCARIGRLIELGVIGRRQQHSINQYR